MNDSMSLCNFVDTSGHYTYYSDVRKNLSQGEGYYGGFHQPIQTNSVIKTIIKIKLFILDFFKKTPFKNIILTILSIPTIFILGSKLFVQFVSGSSYSRELFPNIFLNTEIPSDETRNFRVCGDSDSLVCEDSMESFQWKKELIQSAKKNIVLSGNYCGGSSLDEILELMEGKLQQKVEIILLSSSKFLTEKNKKNITSLKKRFPSLFTVVPTDDIWTINPGLKKVTNHTKGLSIDNGAYFLTGGSGIENKYAYEKGIGDQDLKKRDQNEGSALMKRFLPRAFRDMDFVFKSPPLADRSERNLINVGAHFHYEILKLANLWNNYNRRLKKYDANAARNIKRTLQEFKMDPVKNYNTILPKFDRNQKKRINRKCFTQIFSTGPEHSENPFLEAVIRRIDQARNRIFINHMYFHPNAKLLKSLSEAGNRGVKITIVTNDYQKFSPGGHKFFGPRNKYNCYKLARTIKAPFRKNFRVFAYGQKYHNTPRKTTLHSKAIVVDNCVIAGNSNIGFKSLESMSDHEINFITDSKRMANATIRVFEKNINKKRIATTVEKIPIRGKKQVPLSRRINPRRELTFKEMIFSMWHSILSPLIG